MEPVISEGHQKYSYEDYIQILENLANVVRRYRNESIKSAQRNAFMQSVIDYPIKLILGTSISGGSLEMIGNLDESQKWVGYTRTALEVLVFILLTTKDFGKFEKKKQQFMQAQSLLSSFFNIVKQQIKIKKGFEGDRGEIIQEFTDAFENIKGTNLIIQEFGIHEDVSKSDNASSKQISPRRPSMQAPNPRSYVDAQSARSASADTDSKSESDYAEETEEIDLEMGSRRLSSLPRQSVRGAKCSTALLNDMMTRIPF